MSDTEPCPEELTPLGFGLGVFLFIGTIISYLPQHAKLIQKKSHIGLSLGSAIIGAVNGAAAVTNFLSHQFYVGFKCCEGRAFDDCLGRVLPFLQLVMIYVCCLAILLLYLAFFDKKGLDAMGLDGDKLWRDTWRASAASFIAQFVIFLVYTILVLVDGPYDIVKTYGYVCLVISSIGIISHWAPQIWKTYQLKKIGALSLPMIGLQGFGAILTAFFFSLSSEWYLWLPFVLAAVLLLILMVLGIYYAIKEKNRLKVNLQTENEPLINEDGRNREPTPGKTDQ